MRFLSCFAAISSQFSRGIVVIPNQLSAQQKRSPNISTIDNVLVTAIGAGDLTDDEVVQMIKRFDQKDFQTLLFAARGGGPNSKQRGMIADYWKKSWPKTPRTALISDSTAARFVAQAFAWLLNNELRSFASSELEAGTRYLESSAPLAEVAGTIAALHAAIELKPRRAG